MGSRYLFIVFYCYLEKYLTRKDSKKRASLHEGGQGPDDLAHQAPGTRPHQARGRRTRHEALEPV
jgi:hypothetical protein